MTAAAQLAHDGVPVAIPGAVTPAEIVGQLAFSGLHRPRKFHARRRGAAAAWVDIITAPHTRAVT
jgi:hypothetical protein